MTAHLYGGSAVVTGIYREKGVNHGKPYLRRGRFTDTWVYRDNTRVCVASPSTLILHGGSSGGVAALAAPAHH